eukprot:m.62133 g.62133  ORF g.62133 m.62133 type:complete len:1062 (-) comp8063_c0_seq1:183-3368(-)
MRRANSLALAVGAMAAMVSADGTAVSRINCGGPFVLSMDDGVNWFADDRARPGTFIASTPFGIPSSALEVYRTMRVDGTAVSVPAPLMYHLIADPGTYALRLHFNQFLLQTLSFDIQANGVVYARAFDPSVIFGSITPGVLQVIVNVAPTSTDGVRVQLDSVVGGSFLNGVELISYNTTYPPVPLLSAPTCSNRSVMTCDELGWGFRRGHTTVCGESYVLPNASECATHVTHSEARSICANAGGRLCSVDEIMNDATTGSGCGMDGYRVWSSAECSGGAFTVGGSSANTASKPAECTVGTVLKAVRCCADRERCVSTSETTTTTTTPEPPTTDNSGTRTTSARTTLTRTQISRTITTTETATLASPTTRAPSSTPTTRAPSSRPTTLAPSTSSPTEAGPSEPTTLAPVTQGPTAPPTTPSPTRSCTKHRDCLAEQYCSTDGCRRCDSFTLTSSFNNMCPNRCCQCVSDTEWHVIGSCPTRAPTTQSPTSAMPTPAPTRAPSERPTTRAPSHRPTESPTVSPTAPTATPTAAPTQAPTTAPTMVPTHAPTAMPTAQPSFAPSASPTVTPTQHPTLSPTTTPSSVPTVLPTTSPTAAPTVIPTVSPTNVPTVAPSVAPTLTPTMVPTSVPTVVPSLHPTTGPTAAPTSGRPTTAPTSQPTWVPSLSPTVHPTARPTESPTHAPTTVPTHVPSVQPSLAPSTSPTESPTLVPTTAPTVNPTTTPTDTPTSTSPSHVPTAMPTTTPTAAPTTPAPTLPPTGPCGFNAADIQSGDNERYCVCDDGLYCPSSTCDHAFGLYFWDADALCEDCQCIQPPNPPTGCRDVMLPNGDVWRDDDGYTCDWYASDPAVTCAEHGSGSEAYGYTANTACCVCRDLNPSPPSPPAPPCYDLPLASGKPWHDSDGVDYTCQWYAYTEHACALLSGSFEFANQTARTACCACGGGGGTPLPTPDPPVYDCTTPTTTTGEPTTDPCNSILCADSCTGSCGWSRSRNLCIEGGVTTSSEAGMGDCSGSAPSQEDPLDVFCALSTCSNNCNFPCGWSTNRALCIFGGRTTAAELNLGTGC